MNFLNGWAIGAGIAAAALPVAVHLLTRPKPVRLPLSTLRFVREAIRQRRARHRLRDWLVLALRSLAVLALAGAIARPLGSSQPAVTANQAGATARVVVLDVSQSMAAGNHGIQALEQARGAAAKYFEFRPGLRANLVLAAAAPRAIFSEPSANFGALGDELSRCSAKPERLDVKSALDLAGRMLAKEAAAGSTGRRELVVISDFQRTNWATADFSEIPADTLIAFESAAPTPTPPNLAITRIGWQGRAALDREVVLEVEVGNYSQATRTAQVQVEIGAAVHRLEGTCGAGSRTTLSQAITLRTPGWQKGQARLVDVHDALEADNVRALAVEVHGAPAYAIITRERAGDPATSSYFVERALVPADRQGGPKPPGVRMPRIDPGQLNREVLTTAELIVLDHPGRLAPEVTTLLATLLRRGRSLLYVAAESVDAVNLKALSDAAGSELQLPVDFAPPAAGQARRELFLAEFDRGQMPFQAFGDSLDTLVGPLRFSGGLDTRRVDGTLADDILASYSDRSAALVVVPCGGGALAVLNAELAKSNLPVSPAFVPLVIELVERLLGEKGRRRPEFASGEPLAVSLPTEAGPTAGLSVIGPDGEVSAAGELVDEGVQALWRVPAAGPPGVYQVRRDGATAFALATVVPDEESDLAVLSADVLKGRLAAGREVNFRSAASSSDERDDWWVWLLVAGICCGLGEVVTLVVFRT